MDKLSNRALLGETLDRLGIPKFISRINRRPNLLILNYHRIGDYRSTHGDPHVFSCTAREFAEQIEFLSRDCNLLNPNDLGLIYSRKLRPKSGLPNVLLTFDDGYRDSYETVFPILQSYRASGLFFLPTGLIGTAEVSWWDQIRAILNSATQKTFTLRFPILLKCDIGREGIETVSRAILSAYKLKEMDDSERFIAELVDLCGGRIPASLSDSTFMKPEDARHMFNEGMTLGAHSHSHKILSRLSDNEELLELVQSTEAMRALIGDAPRYFSYPVGTKDSFTERTSKNLAALGYEFAFSFYGGVNCIGDIDQWNVKRCGVNQLSLRHFRTRVLNSAALSSYFP